MIRYVLLSECVPDTNTINTNTMTTSTHECMFVLNVIVCKEYVDIGRLANSRTLNYPPCVCSEYMHTRQCSSDVSAIHKYTDAFKQQKLYKYNETSQRVIETMCLLLSQNEIFAMKYTMA